MVIDRVVSLYIETWMPLLAGRSAVTAEWSGSACGRGDACRRFRPDSIGCAALRNLQTEAAPDCSGAANFNQPCRLLDDDLGATVGLLSHAVLGRDCVLSLALPRGRDRFRRDAAGDQRFADRISAALRQLLVVLFRTGAIGVTGHRDRR